MALIEEVGEGEWLLRGLIGKSCCDSEHISLTEYDSTGRWYDSDPLAEIAEQFNGKCISVRYWTSDEPLGSVEEADVLIAHIALGGADIKYSAHYSEETGFLWCDEDFKVGGHDLIEEVSSFIGKYLLMEVLVHNGVTDLEN